MIKFEGAFGINIIVLETIFENPLSEVPTEQVVAKYHIPDPKLVNVYVMVDRLGHAAVIGSVNLVVMVVGDAP